MPTGEFCQLCATFLVEDPDMETMKKELKDAFRVYDKEGQGFITTETLRGLIGAKNIPDLQFFILPFRTGELLAPLTDEELEGIIEELDEVMILECRRTATFLKIYFARHHCLFVGWLWLHGFRRVL